MNIYVLTIFSAMLAHVAYTWPKKYGLLLLIAGVLLWWVLSCCAQQKKGVKVFKGTLRVSLLWGFIFYTAHFSWLFVLLYYQSQATVWGSAGITTGVILNFMLIFGICAQVVTQVIALCRKRCLTWMASFGWFLMVIGLYGHIVRQWSIWFTGELRGYSLLAPLLPLISFKLIRNMVLAWSSFWMPTVQQNISQSLIVDVPTIAYLQPASRHHDHQSIDDISAYVAQQIYSMQSEHDQALPLCIVGPESTLPFSLNKFPTIVSAWQEILLDNVDLIIGGFRRDESGYCYQSAYHINKDGICQTYDKQHCMPFNEQVPTWWHHVEWAHILFLKDATPITVGSKDQSPVFMLSNNSYVLPVICSEIFEIDVVKKRLYLAHINKKSPTALLWLVNDSWFALRIRRLLRAYSDYASLIYNKKVIYVGHGKKDRELGLQESS